MRVGWGPVEEGKKKGTDTAVTGSVMQSSSCRKSAVHMIRNPRRSGCETLQHTTCHNKSTEAVGAGPLTFLQQLHKLLAVFASGPWPPLAAGFFGPPPVTTTSTPVNDWTSPVNDWEARLSHPSSTRLLAACVCKAWPSDMLHMYTTPVCWQAGDTPFG